MGTSLDNILQGLYLALVVLGILFVLIFALCLAIHSNNKVKATVKQVKEYKALWYCPYCRVSVIHSIAQKNNFKCMTCSRDIQGFDTFYKVTQIESDVDELGLKDALKKWGYSD